MNNVEATMTDEQRIKKGEIQDALSALEIKVLNDIKKSLDFPVTVDSNIIWKIKSNLSNLVSNYFEETFDTHPAFATHFVRRVKSD